VKLLQQSVKLVLACGIAAACLNAQDFYWNTASARSMSMGGVYIPSAGGAIDALAANPAGLTELNTRTIDFSVSAIFARGSFSNAVNSDAPLKDSPGVIPYGAFGMPIGHSRFSVGVGLVPELMSDSNWHYVDAPGAAGASYGLQQQKSAILAARAVAGVGFALTNKISLGASVGAVYHQNKLDAPYIFQTTPVVAGLKTLLDLHTTGVGWNTSVGVIAHPNSRVQLNAAWKSHTVIDSTGNASGNLSAQFAALGLAGVPSTFNYSATVHNVLPQSVLAGVSWRVDGRWVFGLQADWINWSNSFNTLPVYLTNGTNAAVNGLLNSPSLSDRIPVLWKDQYSFRGGIERLITENISIRGGYAHSNNPVPGSTLSPLTAAIMTDQLSTGIGYSLGRWHFDLGYAVNPTAHESVQQSALLSGEYNNSTVHIGTQMLTLNSSFHF
jgi:long-chain fatty acid transport protein